MVVSWNRGTSKSILMVFSIINHPFWGTPIYGNPHIRTRISLIINFPSRKAINRRPAPTTIPMKLRPRSFAPRLQESRGAEVSARRHPWASREHHGLPAARTSGGFHSHGGTKKWMVKGKIPFIKWMMNRATRWLRKPPSNNTHWFFHHNLSVKSFNPVKFHFNSIQIPIKSRDFPLSPISIPIFHPWPSKS